MVGTLEAEGSSPIQNERPFKPRLHAHRSSHPIAAVQRSSVKAIPLMAGQLRSDVRGKGYHLFRRWLRATIIVATSLALNSCLTSEKVIEELRDRHQDFISASSYFDPAIELSYLYQGSTKVHGEPGRFQMQHATLDATIPVPVTKDAFLLTGGTFSIRGYRDRGDFPVSADNLFEVSLLAGAGFFATPNWLLIGEFRPGVYSDFETSLTGSAYQYLGASMAVWRYSESLYLKFGVAVDEAFQKINVFPLLGGAWVVSERWRIDVLLPLEARASFQPSDSLILYAGAWLDGSEYQIREGQGRNEVRDDLHVQELQIGLGLTRRITDRWSITGEIGSAVAGQYELENDDHQIIDGSVEPAIYGKVAMGFSF